MDQINSNEPSEEDIAQSSFTGRKKLLIIIVTLIIVLGLSAGLYLYFSGSEAENLNENTTAVNDKEVNLNTNRPSFRPSLTNQTIIIKEETDDDDRDGLSNDKEKELGTDIKKADTDSDGLSDYEEVYIYKTDPKNKDTDGDGFSDGEEVDKNYNPNGEGQLFNTNSAIENINNNQS
ncbi:MAG: hypothetical protein U5L76_03365 [Patescibacteria group bacterium]|nr:hypothetical protein [Patescibacteria group bacterium]